MKQRASRTSVPVITTDKPTSKASRISPRRSVIDSTTTNDKPIRQSSKLSRQVASKKTSNKQQSTSTHSSVVQKLSSTSSKRKNLVNESTRTTKPINVKQSTTEMNEVIDEDDGNDDQSGDNDTEYNNNDEDEEPRRKRHRTNRSEVVSNDNDGQPVCPNCQKKFGSSLGLQYHIDQFVCQPALRPGGPIKRLGRRKIERLDDDGLKVTLPTKTYKKIRGNINDRTCPQCQRVFTSVAGMQYHQGTFVEWIVRLKSALFRCLPYISLLSSLY
jgi:hypothetical protein